MPKNRVEKNRRAVLNVSKMPVPTAEKPGKSAWAGGAENAITPLSKTRELVSGKIGGNRPKNACLGGETMCFSDSSAKEFVSGGGGGQKYKRKRMSEKR
jgi:hypothetical protein